MPGILGGIIGSISAGFAEYSFMGSTSALTETFKALKDGKRTTGEQGWIQLGALGITLVISVLSGSLCGYLASHVGKSGEGVNDRFNLFTDDGHWEADDGIDYNIDRQQEVVTTAVQAENKVAGEVNAYAAGTPSQDEENAEKEARKLERKKTKKAERKAAKEAAAKSASAEPESDQVV